MEYNLLDGSLNPLNIVKVAKHNHDFYKSHPGYFRPEGLLVFFRENAFGGSVCQEIMSRISSGNFMHEC